MSGALTVPFTILATVLPFILHWYRVSSDWNYAGPIFGVMAAVSFSITVYRVLAREREQRIALEKHLAPRLRLEFAPLQTKFVSKTSTLGFDMLCVRVIARAVSPTVKNCRAYLQRVSQLEPGGERYAVLFEGPFPLPWSFEGPQSVEPRDLNHDVDAFLDVAWFADPKSGHIPFGLLNIATVLPDQFRAILKNQILPSPERNLKIDLLLTAEDSENATLSLNIHRGHSGQPQWDQPQICWMDGRVLRRESNIQGEGATQLVDKLYTK